METPLKTLACAVLLQAVPQLHQDVLGDATYVPYVVDALKWAAQLLLVATGLWALLGAESIRIEPSTGKRRLTSNGWTRILLLIVGLALFAATDSQQKTETRRREQLKEEELHNAREQLEYMKRLVLTQNELSGVRLVWTLDLDLQREMQARLVAPDGAVSDVPVLAAAFQSGALEVRRVSGARWAVHVEVERDGARFARRYEQTTLEWRVFESALLATFGECRVELTSGALLAEPLGRHWPCRVSKPLGALLSFEIEKPGATLAALDNAALVVTAGPSVVRMPTQLRLVSLDRKAQLDQALTLEWKSEELESYRLEGAQHTSRRLRSAPQPLYATIAGAL